MNLEDLKTYLLSHQWDIEAHKAYHDRRQKQIFQVYLNANYELTKENQKVIFNVRSVDIGEDTEND